jgi:PAS domain S-box-containing protein
VATGDVGAGDDRAVLDTFFDSAPVGLAFLDRDLRFRRVNPALARLNGVPAEAHIGRTVRDVLPDQGPEVVELLQGVLDTGEAVETELSGFTPASPVRHHWIVGLYRVCDAAGETLGLGATVTDITERVAAEERARFLARAGEVLGRSLDFETTLRDVASLVVPDRADWCVIDLLEPGGIIRRVAVAHTEPEKERLGWEMSARYPPALEGPGVLSTVLRTGEPILVGDVDDAMLRAGARDEEHLEILRSLDVTGGVTAPLVVRGRVIGAITFAYSASRRPARMDLELATDLARLAASAIDNARVYRDRSHIARTLQRSLLPPRLPRIAGFDIAARYRAAGEGSVGGDFYDVFQRTDSSWIVVLGDVCGKGAEAAALTALARHTLRAAAIATGAPEDLLDSLNEAILRDRTRLGPGDRFMTAVSACLDLDPDDPTLTIGVAGHPPPIVVRAARGAEPLDLAGRALGLMHGVAVGSDRVALQRGDALLLYTDGVLDAGAPRRPLSVDELTAAVAGSAGEPAARIAEVVERAALERATGDPRDDIAIVVLRREPVGG